MLVFVSQWLSLHWEILIIFLSQFQLTSQQAQKRIFCFIAQLITFLVLIGIVFVKIFSHEMFRGRISFNSVLLLLLMNFVSGFRLELMYISLIVSIRSNFTHLHAFQVLVLLPQFIEINFFVCTNRIKSSESKVKFRQPSNCCKSFLKLPNLHMLLKKRIHHFQETWHSGFLVNF